MAKQITLPVQGMTCASCVVHVERALKGLEGVNEASVNLATEQASVALDLKLVPLDRLVDAVRDVGYDVSTEKATLPIGGMTCASCVAHVEGALAKTPGVLNLNVNLATEKASVEYIPTVTGLPDFRRAVAEVGYEVLPTAEEKAEEELSREVRKMQASRRRMILAWAFTIPIILWMLPEMLLGVAWPNMAVFNLGMLLLAVPVLFWVGQRTYVAAWRSSANLLRRMDIRPSVPGGNCSPRSAWIAKSRSDGPKPVEFSLLSRRIARSGGSRSVDRKRF